MLAINKKSVSDFVLSNIINFSILHNRAIDKINKSIFYLTTNHAINLMIKTNKTKLGINPPFSLNSTSWFPSADSFL